MAFEHLVQLVLSLPFYVYIPVSLVPGWGKGGWESMELACDRKGHITPHLSSQGSLQEATRKSWKMFRKDAPDLAIGVGGMEGDFVSP